MSKTIWKIIGRGKNGWHADGLSDNNRCSSSGGTLEGYCREAEDGTIVYDAKETDYDSFAEFVCKGPMLDISLEAGTANIFNEHKAMANMMPALGGAFVAIAAQEILNYSKGQGKKLSSLDMLATDLWMALFNERVAGVRWGKVVGGVVVWDYN